MTHSQLIATLGITGVIGVFFPRWAFFILVVAMLMT